MALMRVTDGIHTSRAETARPARSRRRSAVRTIAGALVFAFASEASDAQTNESSLLDAVRKNLEPPLTMQHLQAAERARAGLDSLPGASAATRVEAHAMLGQFFRDIDYDDGIAFHANAVMELASRLDSTQRVHLSHQLIYAYRNLAEVVAGHGNTPTALELLIHAPAGLPGVPGVVDGLADEVARYQMVGQPPPRITAPHWFNEPTGTTTIDPSSGGPVTVVELTAWWCPACTRSYPALLDLQKKYGSQLRVVLATSLMGRFRADSGLSPSVELAKLREYFTVEHKLACPIAIADNPGEEVDPVGKAYHVYAIPETLVIDRQGRVTRILLGWDEGNPQRVDEAIKLALGAPAA
jgi:thiol-disulfide isomerase/thioredoxin